MFLFTPFPKSFVLCPFLPRVKNDFFFLVHLHLHKKVPLFFFFFEISTALTATTTNHCQVCYILPLPNFPHMGSDLPKVHHSAPYCPTQELPKKLHATSRHPKLIAHVHNFKIILPTQMNSLPSL